MTKKYGDNEPILSYSGWLPSMQNPLVNLARMHSPFVCVNGKLISRAELQKLQQSSELNVANSGDNIPFGFTK